ncbi:hypothetical protein JW968_06960 [Candidatus Woesearchaeota archaeon]|nr:hypothetical protein [Candidatus Woesearchaeota archaeon]
MPRLCLKCKSETRGSDYCPRCSRQMTAYRTKSFIEKFSDKKEMESSSPGVFVGLQEYPRLSVGILNPIQRQDAWQYDSPKFWSESDFRIEKIMDFRSSVINSRGFTIAKRFDKQVEMAQEVAMASKPVDVEVEFKKRPFFRMNLDPFSPPVGAYGDIERAEITSSPSINTKIEKVVGETDLRAVEGVKILYEKQIDENQIIKLLSVGTLGVGADRKLVPTRWSITATDDMVSKFRVEEVKNFSEDGNYAYFGGYLGNYYLILFIPGVWSYELFEIYAGSGKEKELKYSTDHEFFGGRKDYAQNCVGGYYAARLGIADLMRCKKFQSSVLCLRFITDEYYAPLGVWVVREATRKALKAKPLEFGDKDLMLHYAKIFAQKKFGIDLDGIFRKSLLLKELKTQKRLSQF